MGIIKQKDGKYTVSCHMRHPITRKPMSLRRFNISSQPQAEKIMRELLAKLVRKADEKIYPFWGDLLKEYEQYLPGTGVQQITIYNRLSVIRHHTLIPWREKLVKDITSACIHEILIKSFEDKSEAHKKYFVNTLRSIFEFCVSRNYLNRNPTPLLKFKISTKIKLCLNEQQILQCLKKAQEENWPWYPHYSLALYTGMRNGELYALTWDKVNLETRKIIIDTSWSSKDGFKSTKSGDDRIIEIPAPLLPMLQEMKLKSNGSHFVLPRMTKWDKGEQARELRFFLKSIGLPEIRFHDLRASWATWLLSKGVAPSKVMSMGGWKDMDTMMIYMRKAGIDIEGATSVLDDIHTHGVSGGTVISLQRNI